MSLQVLVDMNLSPDWIHWFELHQFNAIHWSTVGDARATDRTLMEWALARRFVVFTHDLDFGSLLALTKAAGPSVIQVRAQDVMPDHLGRIVLAALQQYQLLLEQGALVVVDESTTRARILPLR